MVCRLWCSAAELTAYGEEKKGEEGCSEKTLEDGERAAIWVNGGVFGSLLERSALPGSLECMRQTDRVSTFLGARCTVRPHGAASICTGQVEIFHMDGKCNVSGVQVIYYSSFKDTYVTRYSTSRVHSCGRFRRDGWRASCAYRLLQRAQKVDRRPGLVVVSKPAIVVARVLDGWHAVVDGLHQLIGLCRDDREGVERRIRAALARSPRREESGQGIGCAVGAGPVLTIARFQIPRIPRCGCIPGFMSPWSVRAGQLTAEG
jgi:hypothetical protein